MKVSKNIKQRTIYPYRHLPSYPGPVATYVVRVEDGDAMKALFEALVACQYRGGPEVPPEDTPDYRAAKWLNELRAEPSALRKVMRYRSAIDAVFLTRKHAEAFIRKFGGAVA